MLWKLHVLKKLIRTYVLLGILFLPMELVRFEYNNSFMFYLTKFYLMCETFTEHITGVGICTTHNEWINLIELLDMYLLMMETIC